MKWGKKSEILDGKFMTLNQSVTHAAGKAGRIVPRRFDLKIIFCFGYMIELIETSVFNGMNSAMAFKNTQI